MKTALTVMFAMMISGCATSLQHYGYQKSDTDGNLIAYRDWTFLRSGVYAVLYIDSVPITKLITDNYVVVPLKAGKHEIGINGDGYSGENFRFELNVEEKEKYYYEVKPKNSQWLMSFAPYAAQVGTSPFAINVSSEAKFKNEMRNMDQVEIK